MKPRWTGPAKTNDLPSYPLGRTPWILVTGEVPFFCATQCECFILVSGPRPKNRSGTARCQHPLSASLPYTQQSVPFPHRRSVIIGTFCMARNNLRDWGWPAARNYVVPVARLSGGDPLYFLVLTSQSPSSQDRRPHPSTSVPVSWSSKVSPGSRRGTSAGASGSFCASGGPP